MGEQLTADEITVDVPDDWWLIIYYAGLFWVWNLGTPDDANRDELIHRGRVAAGVPPDNDWVDSGNSISLSPGRPHDSLMARATLGTVADLARLDDAVVAEYEDTLAEVYRQIQMEAVQAALATLDPTTLAAVLARPEIVAKLTAAGLDVAAEVKP